MLRRFAAISVVVTIVDVAVFLALRLGGDVGLGVAGAGAIAVAAPLSYALHRLARFADDPHVRWLHQPLWFATLALAAGATEVGVLVLIDVFVAPSPTIGALVVSRAVALASGAVLRTAGYRTLLFERVRVTQGERVDRGPAPGSCRLSVVLPSYDEAERIAATVARVRDALSSIAADGGVEVVVVDDGSRDNTAAVAEAAGAVVVRLSKNRGKGAAVRAGMLAAAGRTVVYTDADLSYDPQQIVAFTAAVEDGWDMVVGSRRHVGTTTLVRAGRLREASGRLFNVLTRVVLLGNYRDTQCGLKAFRSDVARLLFGRNRVDRFAFDVELFHLAERYRLSLREVPVTVENSARSTVSVARDAARMLRDVFRVRSWAGRGVYDLTPSEVAAFSRDTPPQ